MSYVKTILPTMHLMVDALCACCVCLLAAHFGVENVLALYITYNVAAFLTQPLTGLVADRMPSYSFAFCIMLTACVTALALGIQLIDCGNSMILHCMVAVLGLGNSCFHVWAGRQTTLRTNNDIRWLGVFVSTGAVGLSIGTICSSWLMAWILLLSIISLTMLFVNYENHVPLQREESNTPLHTILNDSMTGNRHAAVKVGAALVCILILALMAIVSVRSMAGSMLSHSLTQVKGMVLMAGIITMAGKVAGGWIARSIGLMTTLFLAVAVTALCMVFCKESTVASAVGLFAINCTMPLTLYLINVVMQGREALAFGLLAASLMPAYFISIDAI